MMSFRGRYPTFNGTDIVPSLPLTPDPDTLRVSIVRHLKKKLPRNRSLKAVLCRISQEQTLSLQSLTDLLATQFPYFKLASRGWKEYTLVAANWLDYAGLAIREGECLLPYDSPRQIRDLSHSSASRRKRISAPGIGFGPVVEVARRLSDGEPVNWGEMKETTVNSCLTVLADLGFISRRHKRIELTEEGRAFARDEANRVALITPRALEMKMFRQFIELLKSYDGNRTQKEIAADFMKIAQVKWSLYTMETRVKIMLDWARHLGLAPGPFIHAPRGKFRKREPMPLFKPLEREDARI